VRRLGQLPRIMLVCVTPASYRENAASISGAKGYLEYTGELIFCAGRRPAAAPVAKPFLGKPAALSSALTSAPLRFH